MKKSLLGICLVLASAVGANAATITFTSSTAFFAALGATPFTTEGYEGLSAESTIPTGATVNGITYTALPAGSSGRIDTAYASLGDRSLALTGSLGISDFFSPGQSIDVSFAPTTALGIFFNSFETPTESLFIRTGAGDQAGNGAAYDQASFYFVGLISDSPFSSARIGATSDAQTGYNLDNLTLATGATPIPEPASMFLLGSGLLALRMRARRSRP